MGSASPGSARLRESKKGPHKVNKIKHMNLDSTRVHAAWDPMFRSKNGLFDGNKGDVGEMKISAVSLRAYFVSFEFIRTSEIINYFLVQRCSRQRNGPYRSVCGHGVIVVPHRSGKFSGKKMLKTNTPRRNGGRWWFRSKPVTSCQTGFAKRHLVPSGATVGTCCLIVEVINLAPIGTHSVL